MAGFRLNLQDLIHILRQIKIAENHTATGQLVDAAGVALNALTPWGLRTVSGEFNNLVNPTAGAADQTMPRLLTQNFGAAGPDRLGNPTSYAQTSGSVYDAQPRIISNLVSDQSPTNPVVLIVAITAAGTMTQAAATAYARTFSDTYQTKLVAKKAADLAGDTATSATLNAELQTMLADLASKGVTLEGNSTGEMTVVIPNVMTDFSAPYNGFMTIFGQFFDHGLDLIGKGGSGNVYIPLQPDDPLYVPGSPTNFMVLTRASNTTIEPGADGIVGTADDVRSYTNKTTPWVDLNQLYTSHESHQVFLREYVMRDGVPVPTGHMLAGVNGGPPTWADVKAQARNLLGIELSDADVQRVPLVAADLYGNFIPGANGLPQLVTAGGLVSGNLAVPVAAGQALPSGHAFLEDIAHTAAPGTVDHDRDPTTPAIAKTADADSIVGNPIGVNTFGVATEYDDELLAQHYVVGDGRGNENIALTAIHDLFHSEHNQRVEQIKTELLAGGDLATLNGYLVTPVAAIPVAQAGIDALVWDGGRLFQAARFATEMWYQHFVFEEFARTVSPDIDAFVFSNTVNLDPAIVAEFANVVYRFGHSMLNESVDRLAADGQTWSNIGLIEAFLNPVEFANGGPTVEVAAGAIVRGMTRQLGNEIDEFVTSALKNNLVGLPLDLGALNIARGRDTGTPSLNEARADFFAQTGDSRLAPYTSWANFTQFLKNPASVINFVAAYGTHPTIVAATTADAKRDAAMLLVLGGAGAPTDRLDFLNARGAYAGGSLGGLNDVDFWIGGLAEKKMAFSGMLGSTFNFVFEVQLEKLQAGDRFYYLSRTQGMNLLNQLENDSFANLAMRNTDLGVEVAGLGAHTHLPNSIFRTPTYIFEIVAALQTDYQPANPNSIDPEQADFFMEMIGRPSVIREDRNNDGIVDYLEYTGAEHVVLGGSNRAETIVGGEGDDAIWGDGGNDRLEGGFGIDGIKGGDGDDIITDAGTDAGAGEVFHGDGGNDVINGGQGFDLIFGGTGKDFVFGGGDGKHISGMEGDDFLQGSTGSNVILGNEGDDWLEGGDGSAGLDYLGGDNSELFFNSEIIGYDVLDGRGGDTDYDGESGDDIMVQREGIQRNNGMAGFDWVIHEGATTGQVVDMNLNPFANQANFILRDRFDLVEGASGTQFDDTILGRNEVVAALGAVPGGARAAQPFPGAAYMSYANSLTQEGVDKISGFAELVKHLERVDVVAPGTTKVVRAVVFDPAQVVRDANGQVIDIFEPINAPSDILLGGGGSDILSGGRGFDIIDGDRYLNVRIAIDHPLFPNATADSMSGQVYDNVTKQVLFGGRTLDALMLDGTLNPGQLSTVREMLDGDLNNTDIDVALFARDRDDYDIVRDLVNGVDLVIDNGGGALTEGVDRIINVEVLRFQDQDVNVLEALNQVGTGTPDVALGTSGTSAQLTGLVGTLADPDVPEGVANANLRFSWATLTAAGGVGTAVPTTGPIAAAPDGTLLVGPTTGTGQLIRMTAGYQDRFGYVETRSQEYNVMVNGAGATIMTGLNSELIADIIHGMGGADTISGQLGNDIIDGGDGNDVITGGEGNDRVQGGAGNDTFVATDRDGNDVYDGGAGVDTYDTARDRGIGGNIVIDLAAGTATGDEIGTDTLISIENVTTGGTNDTVTLSVGANTVNTGAGNDRVIFTPDAVRDLVVGGDGADTADYSLQQTGIRLDLSARTATVTGSSGTGNAVNDDRISGFEHAVGGAGNDTITGTTGANTLNGGGGNDVLIGGNGSDNLTGGAGNDTFRYRTVTESASIATQFDTITDFRAGDRIDLSAIDARSNLTGDQAFTFIGTQAFTTANQNGSIRAFYDAANNRTVVQVSNDADTAVEMEIVLTGQVNLTSQDFVL